MTAQASDQLMFDGERYALVAFSAGAPFDPTQHGFRPAPASTACWRGYLCHYAVRDARLLLDELSINHRPDEDPTSEAGLPPALNGVVAMKSDRSHIGAWVYRNIALPIAYDGRLVIGRDFIRELYVHMGFHPAWKYRHASELVFEHGVLVGATVLDERLEAMRAGARQQEAREKRGITGVIADWIAKTFDRNYPK